MNNKKWNGKIWEGVYANFNEAPGESDVFDMSNWLIKQKNQLNKRINLKNFEKNVEISSFSESRDYCLPLIVAMESNEKSISVLDFGGGLVGTYLETLASIPYKEDNIEFLIIEKPEICKIGREIFGNDHQINFSTSLPTYKTEIDIIHLGSSLQYIDDWIGLLSDLSKFKAKYMIFADLPAADIDSFVTIQNYYGNKIPVRFWNLSEFISSIENFGYKLIFKTRYIKDSPKKHGASDIDSIKRCFDCNHRLGYFSQLVFRLN